MLGTGAFTGGTGGQLVGGHGRDWGAVSTRVMKRQSAQQSLLLLRAPKFKVELSVLEYLACSC